MTSLALQHQVPLVDIVRRLIKRYEMLHGYVPGLNDLPEGRTW
jgi:hypothetical protein